MVSAVAATSSSVCPYPDRLDENPVEPKGVEDIRDFFGRGREAALGAAGRHGADEDAGIEADRFHANAIAQQRAARERTASGSTAITATFRPRSR